MKKLIVFLIMISMATFAAYAEENTETSADTVSAENAQPTETTEDKVDLLEATATETTTEAAPVAAEALPEEFVAKLLTCSPDTTVRTINGVAEKVIIKGMNNDRCLLRFAGFSIDIPFEQTVYLKTYEDLEKLCNDGQFATYEYKENYRFSNLASELNECDKYRSLRHNGRASKEYPSLKMAIVTDMTAQHKDEACELIFVNEVTIDGKFNNYNVICTIPDDKIGELLTPYREVVDLYGAKEIVNADGSISARGAVANEQTYRVDGKLMYDIQVNGYCKMAEPQ